MEVIESSASMTALRSRTLANGERAVTCSRDGQFCIDDVAFTQSILTERSDFIVQRLIADGLVVRPGDRLGMTAFDWRTALRRYSPDKLDYLILVPTLRCNLSCTYCQVSRVPIDKAGFDWSEETLASILAIIDKLEGDSIKIEFQGGEPTLRCDLIWAVIERCKRFPDCRFVICTNLERLDDEIEELLAYPNVHISTSLDGDDLTHTRNRAGSVAFRANLRRVVDLYGPSKISALPTVDAQRLPDVGSLIEAYAEFGLTSIFLRPVTYHGFARKRHSNSLDPGIEWRAYHRQFVERIIARNWEQQDMVMDETYLSICLRRILQPGRERHVDLRQPNPIGLDYVVIDHDGTVYPTDEARMLARSGVLDLAIGDVLRGWDSDERRLLNTHSTNEGDPACEQCAYQPYCGRDVIDDLARYGTIDVPRHDTEFCRRHLHMFDLAFELLDSDDPAVRYSLARWLNMPADLPLERWAA
jgi:His-Xaa-Ser system radical SAM maturase HxsB